MYEHDDKSGRLFAHQLKAKRASNQIVQMCNVTGSIASDPGEINILKGFYSKLYTSETPNADANLL